MLNGSLVRWRETDLKFLSVSQVTLGIGLRSALGYSAVKRMKVEAGRQAFLMAVASPSGSSVRNSLKIKSLVHQWEAPEVPEQVGAPGFEAEEDSPSQCSLATLG